VSQVRRESPAEAAGINVDDEILAIDDFRILPDRLDARLNQYRAGDRVRAVVVRRDQLLRLDITLGTEPARYGRLAVDPMAPEAAVQQRTRWLAPGS
jgi:predicted metalloprotease with PDZ domain